MMSAFRQCEFAAWNFVMGPSAGVDPVSRRALWEILLERKANLAILLVTHYTDEADILSDQVI